MNYEEKRAREQHFSTVGMLAVAKGLLQAYANAEKTEWFDAVSGPEPVHVRTRTEEEKQ